MSKRDSEEEFENINDEDFEDEDFEDEDFDDDDCCEDDDEDCSEEDEDYLPTSEVIMQFLDPESEYANEAASIIEAWNDEVMSKESS